MLISKACPIQAGFKNLVCNNFKRSTTSCSARFNDGPCYIGWFCCEFCTLCIGFCTLCGFASFIGWFLAGFVTT